MNKEYFKQEYKLAMDENRFLKWFFRKEIDKIELFKWMKIKQDFYNNKR